MFFFSQWIIIIVLLCCKSFANFLVALKFIWLIRYSIVCFNVLVAFLFFYWLLFEFEMSLTWWLLVLLNLLLHIWFCSLFVSFWFDCPLPCNEWQNFFVLFQSSFNDKLNIENDGSPVVSLTMFKNFGKQFIKRSPSRDEYVSSRTKPLHLQ